MTFFDVRIPGLQMKVIAADGNAIDPIVVDEFRMGTAETYDVIVTPQDRAYVIFAQSEDRTGYARGILAPRAGMASEIPQMDPRPVRTMADMGMKMKGMSSMGSMSMPGMDMTKMDAKDEDHSQMSAMAVQSDSKMKMEMEQEETGSPFRSQFPLPQPGPETQPIGNAHMMHMASPLRIASPFKTGPEVATIAAVTAPKLADPGDGLQRNGRRVLAYADLKARYQGTDRRPPTREIELHLTGNMERFIWGFDGKKFSEAHPIILSYGERVRIILVNDTMMEHPIHLHGLWSELENGHGEFNPYKHTLIVKPAERISYLVTADASGHWAYHCHLMFHMEAGMFRTVVVQ
jgi:CopA family copper-resistance protein